MQKVLNQLYDCSFDLTVEPKDLTAPSEQKTFRDVCNIPIIVLPYIQVARSLNSSHEDMGDIFKQYFSSRSTMVLLGNFDVQVR